MRTETSQATPLTQGVPNGRGTFLSLFTAIAVSTIPLLASGGCGVQRPYLNTAALISPQRLERGYTLLLPGIGGCTSTDHELTVGLVAAGVPSAIEMYDWTDGPWLQWSNLRGLQRNRREAQKVAAKIVAYQDRYPGRPVYVVGYSGGAAMAVLAMEALPPGRKITGAILLAATLAPDYDLRAAMRHSESPIRNFYSPVDVPILMVAISAVGTSDGRHTVAAGAWGFTVPKGLDPQQRRQYEQGLVQQRHTLKMLASGHRGGHFGWVRPRFVENWVAPLVIPPLPVDLQTVTYQRSGADGGVASSAKKADGVISQRGGGRLR